MRTKKKMSRKPIIKDRFLGVYVEAGLKRKIGAYVEKNNITFSEFLRMCIEEKLANRHAKGDKK